MGLLQKLFGKRGEDANTTANRARQTDLAGRGYSQTADEQQATRSRMEEELSAQRDKRDTPAKN